MKVSTPVFDILRKHLSGDLPDILEGVAEAIPPSYAAIGEATMSVRPLMSHCMRQVHHFNQAMEASEGQHTVDFIVGGPTLQALASNDMLQVMMDAGSIKLLYDLLWEFIHADMPILASYDGVPLLCDGWKVCVDMEENIIPPLGELFEPEHLSRKFTPLLGCILTGGSPCRVGPCLPPLAEDDVVVGIVEDIVFRQMFLLRKQFQDSAEGLRLSPDRRKAKELMLKMLVRDYLELQRKGHRLVTQITVMNQVLMELMKDLIKKLDLPGQGIRVKTSMFQTLVKGDWQLVIPRQIIAD